jgi:hypothetical protein
MVVRAPHYALSCWSGAWSGGLGRLGAFTHGESTAALKKRKCNEK